MGWLKNVWRRRSREPELDAELRFQVERQIDDYVKDGLSRTRRGGACGSSSAGWSRRRTSAETSGRFAGSTIYARRAPRLPRSGRDRLFAVSVTASWGSASPRGDHVQRARCGRAPAAPVCAAGRTRARQHPPDRAEPMGRDVDGQSGRLARAEPDFAAMTCFRRTTARQVSSRASTRHSARRKAWSARSFSICSARLRSSAGRSPGRIRSAGTRRRVSEGL